MIAEAIVGAVTAVTLGGLWLGDRVVRHVLKAERELDDEPQVAAATPSGGLRPWHDPRGDCALCGQNTHYLRMKGTAKALTFTCPKCTGTYKTKPKTSAK